MNFLIFWLFEPDLGFVYKYKSVPETIKTKCRHSATNTLTMKTIVVALLPTLIALAESKPSLKAKDLLPLLDGPVIPELGKFVATEIRSVDYSYNNRICYSNADPRDPLIQDEKAQRIGRSRSWY